MHPVGHIEGRVGQIKSRGVYERSRDIQFFQRLEPRDWGGFDGPCCLLLGASILYE